MAVHSDPDVTIPQSTGAVEFNGEPVTTEQTVDNASTDAVEQETWGETSVDYHGADAVVRSATPTEPVTMTVSWKSDTQAKVVEPAAEKPAPKKTSAARTKKK